MEDFGASEFVRRALEGTQRMREAAIHATDEFGEHVLGQAQQLAPLGGGSHSPYDPAPGTLKASATSEPAEIKNGTIEKVIGFNTEYAAVQHEDLDFGHDTGQAKYLSAPLDANQVEFAPYVAQKCREELEG